MTNGLVSLIFCLELLACASSFADAQQTLGLNIVYTKVGGDSSAGPLPTVKLSRRERYSQMSIYTEWGLDQIYTGNCSQEYQTIILRSTLSQFDTSPIEHYQLRIELSPADPTHCITIDCADGSVGDSILQRWKAGTFWCNTSATILCPSNDVNTTFYSKLFDISGTPIETCFFPPGTERSSDSAPMFSMCSGNTTSFTCPTGLPTPTSTSQGSTIMPSPSTSLNQARTSTSQGSLIPTMTPSPTPMNCPEDGNWKEAPRCSVAKMLPSPINCSNHSMHKNATRVCHCDGNWGQIYCTPSVQLVKELIDISAEEESLKTVLELSPNSINNNDRLDILQSAYINQRLTGITASFIKASLDVVEAIPVRNDPNATILTVLDRMALDLKLNTTITSTKGSIVLRVRGVFPSHGRVLGIQVDNSSISLPGELVDNLNKPEFVASFHFKNISHLLPGRDPISPVISSILSCTDCRTSNLRENVTILFDLLPRMTNNDRRECVFADLRQGVGSDFWNSSGCESVDLDNGSVLCSCNHLTHFAILLSPGVETSENDRRVLTVIGQVFVSISLVFLLATILAFVLQKSLWNMRNYIHCMLCANLIAAQLVFVVGVERTENEAVCSAIAVLLHYLFLVVFMWMLMEGVVLYVKLVKVFITHHKRYIAFFTITSYGVPLLYMLPMVPIGLLVNTDDLGHHYGYFNATSGELIACWLRYDTHFVWAFIAPVVLIIVVNVGFLIMALVIMYRHLRKQDRKSDLEKAKHWLKVTISLVVVMGIAWIGNLLFFNINLIFVAYIMTIFIACQGIIIFILFVPLSKQVRDAYSKWWRRRQLQSAFLSKIFPTTKGTTLPISAESKQQPRQNGNVYESVPMDTHNSVHTLKLTEEGEEDDKVVSSCTLSPVHSENSLNSPTNSVVMEQDEEHAE